jgi:hypothetical protein
VIPTVLVFVALSLLAGHGMVWRPCVLFWCAAVLLGAGQ